MDVGLFDMLNCIGNNIKYKKECLTFLNYTYMAYVVKISVLEII